MAIPLDKFDITKDRVFKQVSVAITGRLFINCTFDKCDMLVAGGPLHFDRCKFLGVKWVPIGPLEDAINEEPDIEGRLLKLWKSILEKSEGPAAIDGDGNIRGL